MKKLLLIVFGAVACAQTVDTNPRKLAVVTFANLGTPANGTIVYCSDCTSASPTASGGTGAEVRRENGAWNGPGGGSSVVQQVTVNISAAQIKTLNASPVTIVAAQGAGTYIEFVSATLKFVCASCTQYTSGGNLYFVLGTTGVTSGYSAGNFDGLSATTILEIHNNVFGSIGDLRNTALSFWNASGPEFATGTGTLVVQAQYIVHTGL